MYSIKGVVAEKTIKGIILEAGNVAYEVIASTTTKEAVTVGKETTLYTFLKLRHNEGDVELYGFSSKEEKQLFLLLTSVNKIGPKTALNILSATSLSKLQSAIGTKKIDFLKKSDFLLFIKKNINYWRYYISFIYSFLISNNFISKHIPKKTICFIWFSEI